MAEGGREGWVGDWGLGVRVGGRVRDASRGWGWDVARISVAVRASVSIQYKVARISVAVRATVRLAG